MPEHPRAVVFDLDGTLVETAADIHAVLAEVLAEAGLTAPTLSAVRGMIGDGARVLVERALAARGHDADLDTLHRRFTERYAEVPCRHSTPFAGAVELLAALRRDSWRVGLCTNKPHAPTLGLLRALGLEAAFDSVVGGDRLPGIRKPDPGHLAAVLAELETSPGAAIMVGDSRNDLLTARALGVPCVLVSFGYTAVAARELGADGRDRHAGRAAVGPAAARLTSIRRWRATRSFGRRRHDGQRNRARGDHRRLDRRGRTELRRNDGDVVNHVLLEKRRAIRCLQRARCLQGVVAWRQRSEKLQ